jgi:hypothetical protein
MAQRNNPNYRFGEVLKRTPLQRDAHQCRSYQYRTNQIMRQAYTQSGEFGRVARHAERMGVMTDKQAYEYAVKRVAAAAKPTQ